VFLAALLISAVVIRVLGIFTVRHFTKLTRKTNTKLDDRLLVSIKKYLIPAAYLTAFYLSTKILIIGPRLSGIINTVILAAAMVFVALLFSSMAILLFNKYWETKRKDANKDLAIRTISGLIKIVIWGIALIVFLDNIGLKINTLIAGVGIGGIAIAFAAQSILGDIFCFFTIFFDRPFEIGDYIVAGTQSGTVEHIGLKTTRLRSLNGEQLIFSNTDLTSSRIQNFKTMEQRRVLFTLGVTYDTSYVQLKSIPSLIREIIESVPDTLFGRAHFVSYGDFSLNFEIVYFILSNDYDKYMDIHQEINLAIKAGFEKQAIAFAYPTQTIQLIKTKDEPKTQ
jgi:small-conductance mechanosensitive channel